MTGYKLCVCCGATDGLDRCHIRSKGSGGSMDDNNIVLMCREHHQMQHKIGWIKLLEKFPHVKQVLFDKGWHVVNEFGVNKLRRI